MNSTSIFCWQLPVLYSPSFMNTQRERERVAWRGDKEIEIEIERENIERVLATKK